MGQVLLCLYVSLVGGAAAPFHSIRVLLAPVVGVGKSVLDLRTAVLSQRQQQPNDGLHVIPLKRLLGVLKRAGRRGAAYNCAGKDHRQKKAPHATGGPARIKRLPATVTTLPRSSGRLIARPGVEFFSEFGIQDPDPIPWL